MAYYRRPYCGGENENYITPEQSIPDHIIKVPWESCVTLGTGWMYRYSDTYKSTRTVVKLLVDVVSRGGNLALNIGPQPDGRLPMEAVEIVNGLGEWLKTNGDAIYGTRAYDVAQIDKVMFTKKGDTVYAIIPLEEGEALGEKVFIPIEKKIERVTCLGFDDLLKFEQTEQGIIVTLPCELLGADPYAVSFELK